MDRNTMLSYLLKVAKPVLESASKGRLTEEMSVSYKGKMNKEGKSHGERERYSYLEAVSRLLCGIAPWLDAENVDSVEYGLQEKYSKLAQLSIESIVNPDSPDYANFEALNFNYSQILVDTAFLAHAILRAPKKLNEELSANTRKNIVRAFEATRKIRPCYSNWILFSVMVEAGLEKLQGSGDIVRVDYGMRQFEQWYVGDSFYKDGPEFAMDYYNSYVIHPMLLDIADTFPDILNKQSKDILIGRSKRYAEILERFICNDGTFIAVGRSMAYRCGAFQLLAQLALQNRLPDSLAPGQVRCALGAVIEKTLTEASFRDDGFLNIGLCTEQPDIGEGYISTGSLYLCSTAFLPLGLSLDDVFWTSPPMPWTQKSIWNGENCPADYKKY